MQIFAIFLGNLIRKGDLEGYNSMARMYTIEYALDKTEIDKILNDN